MILDRVGAHEWRTPDGYAVLILSNRVNGQLVVEVFAPSGCSWQVDLGPGETEAVGLELAEQLVFGLRVALPYDPAERAS